MMGEINIYKKITNPKEFRGHNTYFNAGPGERGQKMGQIYY
jgi:hypothetical protein